MPALTVQQAFDLALQQHRAGKLAEAEALYRKIVAAQPQHAEAWHFLGVIAHQMGRDDSAVECIRHSLSLHPRNAVAHSDLGDIQRRSGRLDEAIASFREALAIHPESPEFHNNLGAVLAESGRFDEAMAAFHAALRLKPDHPETHVNLGNALSNQGRFDEATREYERALQLRPQYAEAHYNLGNTYQSRGQYESAIASYHEALSAKPDYAKALNNLGNALSQQCRLEEAIVAYRDAISRQGNYGEAYNNLGTVLMQQGELEAAREAFIEALRLNPNSTEAHVNIGNVFRKGGGLDEAIVEYQRALELDPNNGEALNNLGGAFTRKGLLDEAVSFLQRALCLKPNYPVALNNLANALKDRGESESAIATYRKVLQINPDSAETHSNLIFSLQFQPEQSTTEIVAEQSRWNRQFSDRAHPLFAPFRLDRNPERRLRIGYVSTDLRDQVVGRNIWPLFAHHDPTTFDLFCYSGVVREDRITELIRQRADGWQNTLGMNDDALATKIRHDAVDILVDLSQHAAGNRLTVFARRPAPVQVSFAGYPESTGVEAIGYRISDRWLEAKGSEIEDRRSEVGRRSGAELRTPSSELRAAERVYLIDSFWCYDPCGMEVAVNELPTLGSGRITFGSLNNFCKVNDLVLELWARVLGAVKDSRLILLSGYGSHRQRTVDFLAQHGVEPERVEFVAPCLRKDYLELYHRLDVALDPFPYGGHTTSLDALWMGVPVVSLAGERAVSRAGLSILSNLGLPELVTFSQDEYVSIASRLAGDVPRLGELRRTLRSRMEASVLMDGPHFARQIEAAYRAMWRDWCAKRESAPP